MGYGQQESSSKSQQQSFIPAQKKQLEKALAIYGPQMGKGQESYTGERVSPFTQTQQDILDSIPVYSDLFRKQSTTESMPLYQETGQSLQGLLSGTTGAELTDLDAANRTFTQTRAQPTRQEFTENQAPLLREEFAGPGYWASARANAVTDAGQDMEEELLRQRTGYLWDVEQQNKQLEEARANRAMAATPLGMQYSQMPMQQSQAGLAGLQSAFGFAGAEQAQKQAEINAAMEKFAEQNRITDPEIMSIMMGLLGLNYSSGTSSGSSSGFQFTLV